MSDSSADGSLLNSFVTASASFSIAADTEALPGQRKLGKMYPPGRFISGEFRVGDGHTYSIVCDEPPFLEGEGTAPQPLQYFLVGAAF